MYIIYVYMMNDLNNIILLNSSVYCGQVDLLNLQRVDFLLKYLHADNRELCHEMSLKNIFRKYCQMNQTTKKTRRVISYSFITF